MTVNLALWALHLLAAKDGFLGWDYKSLKTEVLSKDCALQPKLSQDAASSFDSSQSIGGERPPRRNVSSFPRGTGSDSRVRTRSTMRAMKKGAQSPRSSAASLSTEADDIAVRSNPPSNQNSFVWSPPDSSAQKRRWQATNDTQKVGKRRKQDELN